MTQPDGETQNVRIPGGLLPVPPVAGHSIQRDEAQHAFLIDQKLITCTRTEYRVLALLLERADRCVSYTQLSAQCQDELLTDAAQIKQARIRIMHVMSDLRSKIWALGLDIVAVMNTGYILFSLPMQELPASPVDRGHTTEVREDKSRQKRAIQADVLEHVSVKEEGDT